MRAVTSRTTALLLFTVQPCMGVASADVLFPAEIEPLLRTHCLDCHEGARAKGGLDLVTLIEQREISESTLRSLRKRLAKRDMPPSDEEERPTDAEYAAAVAKVDAIVAPSAREVPLVRRLNRAQYAGALRDVLACSVDVRTLLPADEVGEGFDTTASTLVLPALLVEKYFDAAERIASECVPPESRARKQRVAAEKLERKGQGGAYDGAAWLATMGSLTATIQLAHAGSYRFEIEACAQQAGDEVARMSIVLDGRVLATHDVPQDASAPGKFVLDADLAAGEHTIAARFVNDFYDPNAADKTRRDRNLGVVSVTIDGPLGHTNDSAFELRASDIAGDGPQLVRLRKVAAAVGEELFHRALVKEESDALARTAREAVGTDAPWSDQLRALVTALLVDPRFLLRVETPCKKGETTRALDGAELASRLSFFLWSSVADAELRRAAKAGELADDALLRAQVRRMIADPRSSSLSTRFATQWLGIDALETKQLDPALYANATPALLTSMRRETELLFDDVVSGRKPVRALLTDRSTHVDMQLAKHYELAAPTQSGFETRAIDAARAGGVLGHASVLLATSNPTRTSPVKRGKWVLEALLDDAPPPPPPGVPQLPEKRDNTRGLSIRELMVEHRSNPDCASCHVRMDAIGLAFEKWDADGRRREAIDGKAIDDRTELSSGRVLEGTNGVAELLAESARFERSLARHLFVYALGRGSDDADDALLDALTENLRKSGEFATLVEGIVQSDAFRTRRDLAHSQPK